MCFKFDYYEEENYSTGNAITNDNGNVFLCYSAKLYGEKYNSGNSH